MKYRVNSGVHFEFLMLGAVKVNCSELFDVVIDSTCRPGHRCFVFRFFVIEFGGRSGADGRSGGQVSF